ncbi:MAG TPA: hypothetical protein VE993_11730, partial [Stellaceae bacterium]|nr:hypothetical protein [Stellaceae bacterium]
KIAVMDKGRIIQTGEAADVLCRPADTVVAGLLGVENILPGRCLGRANGILHVAIGDAVLAARTAAAKGAVSVCIRAEDVAAMPPGREWAFSPRTWSGDWPAGGGGTAINRLMARVDAVTSLGPVYKATLDCGFPLVAYLTKREIRDLGIVFGSPVVAEIEAEAVHVLPAGATRPAAEKGG